MQRQLGKATPDPKSAATDYRRFKCAYCKLVEGDLNEPSHHQAKLKVDRTHGNCIHYNNPLTEFQCSLRDNHQQKPAIDRKSEIKRIFDNYQNFKTTDPEHLPVFFGDSLRNDEIFLDPEGQEERHKNRVQSKPTEKQEAETIKQNNGQQGRSQSPERQPASEQRQKDAQLIKSLQEQNLRLNQDLKVAMDNVAVTNGALRQLIQIFENFEESDQSMTINLDTMLEDNHRLLNVLSDAISRHFKKIEDEHKQTDSVHSVPNLEQMWQDKHRKPTEDSQDANRKSNFPFVQSSQLENKQSASEKALPADAKAPGAALSNGQSEKPFSQSDLDRQYIRNPTQDNPAESYKLKSELFKLLQSDLTGLKELKEKFFQVLLSLDREIGTCSVPQHHQTSTRTAELEAKVQFLETELRAARLSPSQAPNLIAPLAPSPPFSGMQTEALTKVQLDLTRKESQISQLQLQIKDADSITAKLQKEHSEISQKLQQSEEENQRKLTSLADLNTRLKQTELELAKRRSESGEKDAKIMQLETELSRLKTAQQDYFRLQSENDIAKQELSKLAEEAKNKAQETPENSELLKVIENLSLVIMSRVSSKGQV